MCVFVCVWDQKRFVTSRNGLGLQYWCGCLVRGRRIIWNIPTRGYLYVPASIVWSRIHSVAIGLKFSRLFEPNSNGNEPWFPLFSLILATNLMIRVRVRVRVRVMVGLFEFGWERKGRIHSGETRGRLTYKAIHYTHTITQHTFAASAKELYLYLFLQSAIRVRVMVRFIEMLIPKMIEHRHTVTEKNIHTHYQLKLTQTTHS